MASDGSTSMASVCGGSMVLMDAGISLREHAAGVSVGLITDVDPSTGVIKDYHILTDILGLEDHPGDMDFKIAGTMKGITAIQLDIKPAGIPLGIIYECLEPARKGRFQILDHMGQEISAPHVTDGGSAPHLGMQEDKQCVERNKKTSSGQKQRTMSLEGYAGISIENHLKAQLEEQKS